MRKVCCTLSLLCAILWLTGCKNESILRPPKPPEVYNLPPSDPRYSQPPEPPKEYLNQDPGSKNNNSGPTTPGSMGRPGSGGRPVGAP